MIPLNGNWQIIDSHCHIYPEKIAFRAVAGTDAFYGTRAACDGTSKGLEKILENRRIRACLVHSVATTPKQVRSINDFIAQEVQLHPHEFIGFGALHPESEDLLGDFEHLLALGLKGVKIHPDIQRFKLDDEKCLKMYELCEKHRLPILIHTGDPRYDYSNPNRMKPILEKFPRLVVIGAHMGGWSLWDEAYQSLSPYPNFFVDCCSTFYQGNLEHIKELIRLWGADRVLFGSDYPMWNPEKELDILLSFGFSQEEYDKILGGNLLRILGMDSL